MDDCTVQALERRSGERRSKQVLDAAEACVQRLGFHNASMAEIAAAAGMSVGHIYRYFPSKEAIIIAIVRRDCALSIEEIEQVERHPGCLHSALMAHVRRMLELFSEPSKVALALEVMAEAARNARVAEVVRSCKAEVFDRLFGLLRHNRAAGLSESDLRERMEMFDLVMCGLAIKAVRSPDFDRGAAAACASECIGNMLSLEPPAGGPASTPPAMSRT